MFRKFLPLILVLALASLACSFSFRIPERAEPGPDITDEISVAVPESGEARLEISFGAGELSLSPGASDTLVEGIVTYNVPDFEPEIIANGNDVQIKQGDFASLNLTDIKNKWDLNLGTMPMDLNINAGAYKGSYELGGLSLTSLTIKDGASDVVLSFSVPNRTEMSVLRYETGASSVELNSLANANFSTLIFNGGAGDYVLDFSGELRQDATARIETGFGDMSLIIPKGVNAEVSIEGAAVNVNHSSGWAQNGGTYTQNGSGPKLTVIVKAGAGNITLTD